MKVYNSAKSFLKNFSELFPHEIIHSPWSLFHGTTNVSERQIDSEGLIWKDSQYSRKDVEIVVSIFRELDWFGHRDDSVAALSQYSLRTDFKDRLIKPVYFNQTPEQSVGYTMKHRVGGETSGCLLSAIEQLYEFFSDEQMQSEFRARRYLAVVNSLRGVVLPERFVKIIPSNASFIDCVDLAEYLNRLAGRQVVFSNFAKTGHDKLTEYLPWDGDVSYFDARLQLLKPLYQRLKEQSEKYSYGVIYAVEFSEQDRINMTFSRWNGAAFDGNIPPSRILAKAYISERQTRVSSSPYTVDAYTAKKVGILAQSIQKAD